MTDCSLDSGTRLIVLSCSRPTVRQPPPVTDSYYTITEEAFHTQNSTKTAEGGPCRECIRREDSTEPLVLNFMSSVAHFTSIGTIKASIHERSSSPSFLRSRESRLFRTFRTSAFARGDDTGPFGVILKWIAFKNRICEKESLASGFIRTRSSMIIGWGWNTTRDGVWCRGGAFVRAAREGETCPCFEQVLEKLRKEKSRRQNLDGRPSSTVAQGWATLLTMREGCT